MLRKHWPWSPRCSENDAMREVLGCLLLVAACGGDDGSSPINVDAAISVSDASTSNDANVPTTGILVTFASDPALPGTVGPGVVVSSATFRVRSLEVVSDAGSSMTTAADVELRGGPVQPEAVAFPIAPPALYSKVSLDIDGDLAAPSYEILGMANVSGSMQPFRIVDTGRVMVDVEPYGVMLLPGDQEAMPVSLDLRAALNLDFGQLRNVGGVWTLDEMDSMRIATMRDALADAFNRP